MKSDRRHAVQFIVSHTVAHGRNQLPNEIYKEMPDMTKTHRYCCYQILHAPDIERLVLCQRPLLLFGRI